MVTTFSYMTWNMYKCTNEGIVTRGMSCRLWKGVRKPCGRFCLTPHCDVEYSVVQGQNQPQVSTEETGTIMILIKLAPGPAPYSPSFSLLCPTHISHIPKSLDRESVQSHGITRLAPPLSGDHSKTCSCNRSPSAMGSWDQTSFKNFFHLCMLLLSQGRKVV